MVLPKFELWEIYEDGGKLGTGSGGKVEIQWLVAKIMKEKWESITYEGIEVEFGIVTRYEGYTNPG